MKVSIYSALVTFFRTHVSKITIYPSQEKEASPLIDHKQRTYFPLKNINMQAHTNKQTIIAEF
jgi:hypothetical protein